MDDRVTAAARVIYAAGQHHGWWPTFKKSYDELDPIGRSEFNGIIEQALAAADAARTDERPEETSG
jgi:hypothetical protein